MSDCFSTHYLPTTAKKACTPYVRCRFTIYGCCSVAGTLPLISAHIEGFTKDVISVQIVSGAHLAAYSMGSGALSPRVEQPEYVVDLSPPSVTEVKKEWSCTSTPSCRVL